MAIAFRSFGSSPGAQNTNCNISKPSDLAVGDFMIAHVMSKVSGTAISAPAGWNLVGSQVTTTGGRSAVFYKFAEAADVAASNFTFTTGSGSQRGGIAAYTGVDPTTPIHLSTQAADSTSNTSADLASITTTVNNCQILWFVGSDQEGTSSTLSGSTPSGTEVWELPTTQGTDCGSHLWHGTLATAGATGARTLTLSIAAPSAGHVVALKELVSTTLTVTRDGNSRLSTLVTQTKDGNSRLAGNVSATKDGNSRLNANFETNLTGNANIQLENPNNHGYRPILRSLVKVNFANPLSDGLVGSWLFKSSGTPSDTVSHSIPNALGNKRHDLNTSSSGSHWQRVQSPYGHSLFLQTNHSLRIPNAQLGESFDFGNIQDFTFYFVMRVDTNTPMNIFQTQRSTDYQHPIFAINRDSVNNQSFSIFTGITWLDSPSALNFVNTGYHHFAVTKKGGEFSLYYDGTRVYNNTSVTTQYQIASSDLIIGYDATRLPWPIDADLVVGHVWRNRVLTEAEIQQLYQDPFTVYRESPKTILWNAAITGTGSTTTTETRDGNSRLAQEIAETLDGDSRLAITVSTTRDGGTRLAKALATTLDGDTRLAAAVTETRDGDSRVAKAYTETRDGNSFLNLVFAETKDGNTSLNTTFDTTLDGATRLAKAFSETRDGNTRLSNAISTTLTGDTRLAQAFSETRDGNSTLAAAGVVTKDGDSRLAKEISSTTTGDTRLAANVSTTLDGDSRLAQALSTDLTGNTSLLVEGDTTTNLNGNTRLSQSFTETLEGSSFLNLQFTETRDGDTRLQQQVTSTKDGDSRLAANVTTTKTGDARLASGGVITKDGNTRLTQALSTTSTGNTRLQQSLTTTKDGATRLAQAVIVTKTGDTRLSSLGTTVTRTGDTRLQKAVETTKTGSTRITEAGTRNLDGNSRLVPAPTLQRADGKIEIVRPLGDCRTLMAQGEF